jgi:hypothetical protein
MRVAGVKTLEQANQYLRNGFLPWWNRTLTVEPTNPDDAHRKLERQHDLTAILSHVETRQVKRNYTVSIDGQRYVIDKGSICTGLRGGNVDVEGRLNGTLAMRFQGRYLDFTLCTEPIKTAAARKPKAAKDTPASSTVKRRKSTWMDGFWDQPSPSMKDAIRIANATS